MLLSHKGMKISQADLDACIGYLEATLDSFSLPAPERSGVLALIDTNRAAIVA